MTKTQKELNLKVKLPFIIELVGIYKRVNLYTIRIKSSTVTEFDKFLNDPIISQHKDFHKLIAKLDNILNKYGCEDNFFRYASRPTDPVVELTYGKLRLYCCKWSKSILIVGSGGVKSTRTYQEDPKLNQCVEILKYVSDRLEQRIRNKEISINKKGLFLGDLNFEKEN